MEPRFEIIDAFVDGERVDAAALKLALSEPAGRDYLVDVWLLRESLQEEMASEASPTAATVRARGARPWLMAAALAACLIGGYFTGHRMSGTASPSTPSSQPPVVAPAASAQTTGSFPAPVPTRVIQLQFGTDTHVTGGGN
jgi:hypothetical protein